MRECGFTVGVERRLWCDPERLSSILAPVGYLIRHRGRDQKPHRKHKGQQACPTKGLAIPRGVLKSLLKNHLKLAPENDLRSKYHEPSFVERHLELIGEVHGV